MKTVLDAFFEINHQVFDLGGCQHEIGDRKFHFSKLVEFDTWPSDAVDKLWAFTYYRHNKIRLLEKTYLRPNFVENLKAKFDHREDKNFINIGINFGSGLKDPLPEKTGDCMMGLSIVKGKGFFEVGFSFRSSETYMRFIGDLAFLQKLMSQVIDMQEVTKWRFYFHTYYCSLFNFPIWTVMYPAALQKKHYGVYKAIKDRNFSKIDNDEMSTWALRRRAQEFYVKLMDKKTKPLYGPKGEVLQ